MNEEMWCCELPDGRTFRCVKSQLMKKSFKNPATGKKVDPKTGEDIS